MVKMAPGETIRVDELMTEDLSGAVLAKRQREASTPPGPHDYDTADDAFVLKAKVPDEVVPVVTVSLDLAGTLDKNSLPDPVEFLCESSALVRRVSTPSRECLRKLTTYVQSYKEFRDVEENSC